MLSSPGVNVLVDVEVGVGVGAVDLVLPVADEEALVEAGPLGARERMLPSIALAHVKDLRKRGGNSCVFHSSEGVKFPVMCSYITRENLKVMKSVAISLCNPPRRRRRCPESLVGGS